MNKVVFIIPYFGKMKNYFQLFLKSCSLNKTFNWLILTDDENEYDYPENVKVINATFEEVKHLAQSKFDFSLILENPYKLCDFKPAFGYIFGDYIKEYKFWGHCDTDLIFGNISKFITDEMLESYDKIFTFGHLTLYRNTEENNKRFMLPINGVERYKDVFSSGEGFAFDEEYKLSINNIYINYKYPMYEKEHIANIYTKSSNFRLTRWDSKKKGYEIEKTKKAFFVWDNGNLHRYYCLKKQLIKQEYLYIHMQARYMEVKIDDSSFSRYKIIPNCFDILEVDEVNYNNFNKIKHKNFNLHYFRLRSKNLLVKIRKKIGTQRRF